MHFQVTSIDQHHTYVGMMVDNMKNMVIPLGGNIDVLNTIDPKNTFNLTSHFFSFLKILNIMPPIYIYRY